MSQKERNSQTLMDLVRMTYTELRKGGLVVEASTEQQIVIHQLAKYLGIEWNFQNADSYPFVRLGGTWHLSLPKLYLFFHRARGPIGERVDNPTMKLLYDAIQLAQKYVDEVKALNDRLSPRDFSNYEQHQEMEKELYTQYMTKQLALLSS